MNLSNTCKAAIKAVIYLASVHDENRKATIRQIAAEVGENEHTVGKLLQNLVKQDIIQSIKGPTGGFFLNSEQLKQPIMNIIEAVDGKSVFRRCGLGLNKCSENHPCPIHHEYQKARDIIENLYTKKSVESMCRSISRGKAFLSD